MTVPILYYLILAAMLFSIGVAAFLIKRNIITIFMSIELMLNAANLTFLAFSRYPLRPGAPSNDGHAVAFFVMAVAAAEAAVGLAIVIAAFRVRGSINVDELRSLRN